MTREQAVDWADKFIDSLFIRGGARAAMMLLLPVVIWLGGRTLDRQEAFDKALIELSQHQVVDEATIKANQSATDAALQAERKGMESLFESLGGRIDILSNRITEVGRDVGENYARKVEVQLGLADRDHTIADLSRRIGNLERPPEGRSAR